MDGHSGKLEVKECKPPHNQQGAQGVSKEQKSIRCSSLMQEHGNPSPGGLAVLAGAATRFIATVEVADQIGFAPTGDEFAALVVEEFQEVLRLHVPGVAWGIGHPRR